MKNTLSIVIPAKNEEKRIAHTLSLYGSFFLSHQNDFNTEILVVVNNSKDATSRIVDEYSQKFPFIKKIETSYSSGKGGAVALGFHHAEGEYIGFADADGSVPPREVLKLYQFLDETPWLDGVTGIRNKSSTDMSFKRRLISRVFNLYTKLLFSLPYLDTQCGVKIFRKNVAKSMAKKLSKTGWAFDVNLLLVAKYLNFRILEHPVVWSEKEGSHFSMFEGFIKVPWELLTLKYLEVKFNLRSSIQKFIKTDLPQSDKRSRNILIMAWRDIKHPDMGGSEVYVHEVAKRLAKTNRVTLFTSQPGSLSDTDEIDGVKIIRKGGLFGVYIWAFIYYIFYLRKRTDFIIDVENGIPFFTPLYSRKNKLMVLHHVHRGQWFKQFPLPFSLVGFIIEAFLMPLAYRKVPVVTVSPSSLSELKRLGFHEKQIYLAYNSIPAKIGGKFSLSKTPLLLYLGRIKAYKRVEIAVRTIPVLLKEFPKIQLVIGGTGDYLEKLRILVKKLDLEDHVEFTGFVSESKKWELMQKAWVFLMPSMKEG